MFIKNLKKKKNTERSNYNNNNKSNNNPSIPSTPQKKIKKKRKREIVAHFDIERMPRTLREPTKSGTSLRKKKKRKNPM